MNIDDNPFERWGLDPGADEQKLTRQMRAKSRQLPPDERDELQRDWRQLTSEPAARARWVALTPPPPGSNTPWKLARQISSKTEQPELPLLNPTLEDALVLPRLDDRQLEAKPPFLPAALRDRTDTASRSAPFDRQDDQ